MKVSMIGAGRVGLVVAACLAELGNRITVIDIDEDRLKEISNKVSPVAEPGLNEILKEFEIEASSNYVRVMDSDIVFLCVSTPSKEDGSILLEHVVKAAKQIAGVLRRKASYTLIAIKSTVIPGTTEEVVLPLLEKSGKKAGKDFGLCMTPEFLREGRGIEDFTHPARIIIGEYDKKSGDILCNLFQSFDAPILRTDLKTAEMIKYASNAFLTAKLSFINEIGNICKLLGIDVYEVAKGMGFDDRIGSKFLSAGIGFSGPCLPKDLRALIARSKQIGYEPKLLEEVLNLNERQVLKMLELLKKHISLKNSSIGALGLSFKSGTDDVKESKAITVVDILLKEGAKVKVYDPQAMHNFKRLFPQVEYTTPEEVLKCDAILILTEWEEFERLDYKGKIVIDGRRISKAREARIYEGICW